jgi:hypothetical protein
VFSFTDLDIAPWHQLCDLGTLECFDTNQWAYSDDIDRRWVFVELLNYSLREEARNLKLRFNKQQECYYFEATQTLRPRQITYQSISNKTSRTVFRGYPNTENPRYYRHSAFKAKFQLYDNAWYLELVPTYYFTWDGYKTDHFYEDRLKGIKRLESNSAVLGQLIMWSEYLSRKGLMDDGLQLIEFDGLLSFELDSGIDETLWLRNEDPYAKELLSSTEPLLF